jgi:hypothetical protein
MPASRSQYKEEFHSRIPGDRAGCFGLGGNLAEQKTLPPVQAARPTPSVVSLTQSPKLDDIFRIALIIHARMTTWRNSSHLPERTRDGTLANSP